MTGTDPKRLARLAQIAALIRDQAQAELARHARACAQTRQHLASLDAAPAADSDLPPQILEQVALQHSRWAAPQKARLNTTLAAQTALKLQAETAARAAFGRAQVLDKLAKGR